jgi:hypothetical protein
VTASKTATLADVKRVAKTKRRAEQSYRETLVAAHEAGHSFIEIAKAAGIRRQSARELIQTNSDPQAEQRA